MMEPLVMDRALVLMDSMGLLALRSVIVALAHAMTEPLVTDLALALLEHTAPLAHKLVTVEPLLATTVLMVTEAAHVIVGSTDLHAHLSARVKLEPSALMAHLETALALVPHLMRMGLPVIRLVAAFLGLATLE